MAVRELNIRPATDADHDAIWKIFHDVIAPGDTYVFVPDTSRQDALAYWFQSGNHAYVAAQDRHVVGTYILKANRPDLGSHVANASFMVAPSARGQGVGRAMCEHCLSEARRLGFRAMQFNFVVSTNESAIRLWKQLDFEIVGTLPGAFRHPEKGFVDVYVMFRSLIDD
jgi:L-amino acid N-acyltransferase YncA